MKNGDGGSGFIGDGGGGCIGTRAYFALVAALALTACGTSTPHPTTPGEHVVIQRVLVDVPRPCPVKKPVRPAKLKQPLPSDPAALAELLIAKLLQWDGPGGFGDQASDAIDTCIKP